MDKRVRGKSEIDFSNMLQLTGANEDSRLLWRLGHFIKRYGCRATFDQSITDMYLRGSRGRMTDIQAFRLREIAEGKDSEIPAGLIYPRLELLSKLILKINGNKV